MSEPQKTDGGASPEVSLVIPVYNEVENLPVLAGEIRAALDPLALDYEVVWVDDGSTDGSGDELRRLRAADPRARWCACAATAGNRRRLRRASGRRAARSW
jgi:glycosyltransferase involved in cell wall biosynthesis